MNITIFEYILVSISNFADPGTTLSDQRLLSRFAVTTSEGSLPGPSKQRLTVLFFTLGVVTPITAMHWEPAGLDCDARRSS